MLLNPHVSFTVIYAPSVYCLVAYPNVDSVISGVSPGSFVCCFLPYSENETSRYLETPHSPFSEGMKGKVNGCCHSLGHLSTPYLTLVPTEDQWPGFNAGSPSGGRDPVFLLVSVLDLSGDLGQVCGAPTFCFRVCVSHGL